MRAIAGRTHSSEARVRDWMTPDPRVARPDTAAEEAALMMLERGCHHLPVVDEGRPVGMVGMRAVVSETFAPVLVWDYGEPRLAGLEDDTVPPSNELAGMKIKEAASGGGGSP